MRSSSSALRLLSSALICSAPDFFIAAIASLSFCSACARSSLRLSSSFSS